MNLADLLVDDVLRGVAREAARAFRAPPAELHQVGEADFAEGAAAVAAHRRHLLQRFGFRVARCVVRVVRVIRNPFAARCSVKVVRARLMIHSFGLQGYLAHKKQRPPRTLQ